MQLHSKSMKASIWGQLHLEHIPIVYTVIDQGMGDCEETLPIQEQEK